MQQPEVGGEIIRSVTERGFADALTDALFLFY